MATITPQDEMPDQFGRYAIVLFLLAGSLVFLRAFVVAHLLFWMLLGGGAALTLFSLVARPIGSPRGETWLAALLCAVLLGLILVPSAFARLGAL